MDCVCVVVVLVVSHTFACDGFFSTQFTSWPCSKKWRRVKKKRKKTLSFPFTPLLVAININDSGSCENEIPPSSQSAAVTYLPMSPWLFAALLRLTCADTRWVAPSTFADAELKELNTGRCQHLLKKNICKSSSESFWEPRQSRYESAG